MKFEKDKYFNRELSWLSFNYRVLQEAKNIQVPLLERLNFLAIYSSNLDEFYKVRVASYRHVLAFQKSNEEEPDAEVKWLLKKIKKTVHKHQQEFEHIYSQVILPELNRCKILLVNNRSSNRKHFSHLTQYFIEKVNPLLTVKEINNNETPFIENKGLYLVVESPLSVQNGTYYLINVPTEALSRFILLPSLAKEHAVIQLSDIIRMFLDKILGFSTVACNCYEIKLTRDAELYLEEEIAESVLDKVIDSLYKRDIGVPSRFLYDDNMPKPFLKLIRKSLGLKKSDLMPGGRYHNFDAFFNFPTPNIEDLEYDKIHSLLHPAFVNSKTFFEAISKQDQIIHFPYHSYDTVIDFLELASQDKNVISIRITLYRVATDSNVCKALIKAAQNGKDVIVFNEVKARFDEESNIAWGKKMEEAGVKVLYSFNDIKVHCKMCLIERKEEGSTVDYAYLSTGNFNEKTANIYCDHGLFTKDKELTFEASALFDYLIDRNNKPDFKYLLVAPFNIREQFIALINNEIDNAKNAKKATIILKMNSLEDRKMIDKLYEASNAGVKIKIIVRGICCLIPGIEGMSKNIQIVSIIDRFLEHGRIYKFHNGGKELIYLASADWMKRNLSHRIEVCFPIRDKFLKDQLNKIISLQLVDNTKARTVNKTQSNPYKTSKSSKKARAQSDAYEYLKSFIGLKK